MAVSYLLQDRGLLLAAGCGAYDGGAELPGMTEG